MPAQTPKTMPSRRFLRKPCFIFFLSIPARRPASQGRAAGRRSDDQTAEFRTRRADGGEEHERAIERSQRGDGVALERFGVELSHDECPSFLPSGPSGGRSEEHTSELQSLMRISYAVFCLKKKK